MSALRALLAENKKRFEESQRTDIVAEVQQQGLPTADEVRNVVTEAIQNNVHLKEALQDLQSKTSALVNISQNLHDDDDTERENVRKEALSLIEQTRELVKDQYKEIQTELFKLLKQLKEGLSEGSQKELKAQISSHAREVREAIVGFITPDIKESHVALERMLVELEQKVKRIDEESISAGRNLFAMSDAQQNLAKEINNTQAAIGNTVLELKDEAGILKQSRQELIKIQERLSELMFGQISMDENEESKQGFIQTLTSLATQLAPFQVAVGQNTTNIQQLERLLQDNKSHTGAVYDFASKIDGLRAEYNGQLTAISQAISALRETNTLVSQLSAAHAQNLANEADQTDQLGSSLLGIQQAVQQQEGSLLTSIQKLELAIADDRSTSNKNFAESHNAIQTGLDQLLEYHKDREDGKAQTKVFAQAVQRLQKAYVQDSETKKKNAQNIQQLTDAYARDSDTKQKTQQNIQYLTQLYQAGKQEIIQLRDNMKTIQDQLAAGLKLDSGFVDSVNQLGATIISDRLEASQALQKQLEEMTDVQQKVYGAVLKLVKKLGKNVLKETKKKIEFYPPSSTPAEDEESGEIQTPRLKRKREDKQTLGKGGSSQIRGEGGSFKIARAPRIQVHTSKWTNLSLQLALAEQLAAQPMSYVFSTIDSFLANSFGSVDYVVNSKDRSKLPATYTVPFEACIPVCGMCFASPLDDNCVIRLVAVLPSALFFVQQATSTEQVYTRVFGELQKTLLGFNNALLFIAVDETDLLRFVPVQNVVSAHGPSLETGGTNPSSKDIDYIGGIIRQTVQPHSFPTHVLRDFQVRLRTELFN